MSTSPTRTCDSRHPAPLAVRPAARAAAVLRFVGILALALGLAPGLAGCGRRAPPSPPGGAPKVTVARPEVRTVFDQDEFSGWCAAPETVEVRARVRGHIQKVHFRDGELVKAGDPLFTLDRRPLQAELDRAREQVRIYEAQKVAAVKDLARQTELQQKGGASRSQVEQAEAEVGTLDARIQAAKQEVERAKLDLEYAVITAPIGGRTSRALLTLGNLVNAGGSDPLLTTIVVLDPIHVYIYIDERTLQRHRAERRKVDPDIMRKHISEARIPFFFGLEIEEGYPHEGFVDFSDNRIDPATGTLLARGSVPNPDTLFFPGARVRVRVPLSSHEALVIPDTAVLTDQDRKYVLVVGEGGTAVRRDIRPGRLLDDGMRVVLPAPPGEKGLTTDSWVIVLGIQRARVNYPVEPFDGDGKPVAVASAAAAAPPAPRAN